MTKHKEITFLVERLNRPVKGAEPLYMASIQKLDGQDYGQLVGKGAPSGAMAKSVPGALRKMADVVAASSLFE